MVVSVELDGSLIEFLVSVGWLEPRDSYKRSDIAKAIGRVLADAARAYRDHQMRS
jgi:hypothetical protein